MTYQEKQNIVNIFSGLLIALIYGWVVYQKHLQGHFDLSSDFKMWGIIFLIFIGVSIVARILIYIFFHIGNAIATKETDSPISDEREKLIKLKASRNGYYAFSISFISTFVLLALGWPVYSVFIAFVACGLLGEIVDNSSQIYYHRKGI